MLRAQQNQLRWEVHPWASRTQCVGRRRRTSLGKDGKNGAADGIGIGIIHGLRNGGDSPVRMAELVSEVDVPAKDEELVETVQGGGRVSVRNGFFL